MIPLVTLKVIDGSPVVFDPNKNTITFTADADIDSDGGPNIDGDPYWQPETTLKYRGKSINAQTVPFAVIPIGILNVVKGRGLGCEVLVENLRNGKKALGVCADLGPTRKVGEISPAMARLIGLNPNSNHGGTDERIIRYTFRLEKPATINGKEFKLQSLGK